MAPHLVREFGWSRSQFALVGLTMFTTLLVLPFVGRMTDAFGVRATASLGTILTPASIACFSLMNGPFYQYLIIGTGVLAVGTLGMPLVYTRLIVANFRRARGLALTIATCSPAVLGALGAPVLSDFVDAHGWRIGFRALALFLLVLGVVAVLLIAPGRRDERVAPKPASARRSDGGAVFVLISRNPLFWLIALAMFLCSLQTPLHSSQLNLMLLDNHISTAASARMVSVYAIGTVIGRLACGLALDRFPTYLVAAFSMALPAVGYAVLASDLNAILPIALAMFLVGLAVGAEADLVAYLVSRYFDLDIYSTVTSLVYSAVFLASATGAGILSFTLSLTNSFSLFPVDGLADN